VTLDLRRRLWADLSLRAKGFIVLGIPVIAIIAIGLTALSAQRGDDASEQRVRHTLQVRSVLDQLYTALLSTETSARGYVITRDDDFLERHRRSAETVPELLARLDAVVQVPAIRERLGPLHALVERRMRQWKDLVSTGYRAPQSELAASLRRASDTMQELRALLEGMIADEERLLAVRTAEHERLRARQQAMLVAGILLGLFGGAVATYLLADGIVRRAEYLRSAAAALAAGEPLDVQMRGGNDELGQVYGALRRSSTLLAERERALRQANDSIGELNMELQRQLQTQSALNRELEAFSYSVSHDLRAPLRSIDGFSQALLEDYEGQLDATGRSYLTRVRAAAQRMAQLIDDILLLSRVARADLRVAEVDLTAIAREIAQRLDEQEPGRRVDWRIAHGLTGAGDVQLVRIALENLLGNAWKFTSKRDRAVIEFARAEGNGTFVVRDNGAGFDMAYAGKLFGAFQRLHAAADFGGTGIGLATVQRIVTKHGGRIWAEGEVDRGASFFFTLAGDERRT
jgi:signal transduction histidine kinase